MPEKAKEKILEMDLYQPIYNYLTSEGYTVRSEVKNCDITAVRGEDLIVIEMKRSFNATLLMQAVQRQRMVDSVYIAVPRPKRGKRGKEWHGMCHLLRRLELGLILVIPEGKASDVEVVFHPGPYDRAKNMYKGKKGKQSILKEHHARNGDFNIGGSNRRKLMTAYREAAIHIVCCMEKFGPKSAAQLKKLGTGDKTYAILSDNHYGWFERISKGVYGLTPEGQKCLVQYVELAAHYRNEIEKL
jgi:hypothetical protein